MFLFENPNRPPFMIEKKLISPSILNWIDINFNKYMFSNTSDFNYNYYESLNIYYKFV